MTPTTIKDVKDFFRNILSIECSNTWVNKWIEANSSEIFLGNASPLEREGIDVTSEQLKEYVKQFEKELEGVEPSFLFNADESGLDDRKYTNKKVVSLNNNPATCKIVRPAGQITVMPTICADGTVVTPMVNISRKSIPNDFPKYGLPVGQNGYIVQSPKGYMTSDLFESYFETIFIPQIKMKRINMIKPNEKVVCSGTYGWILCTFI